MAKTRKQGQEKRKSRRNRYKGGESFFVAYNSTPVQGQELTVEQTSKKPRITIPLGHTVLLYDPDAIAPSYIHWLASSTKEFIPYRGPTPPPGTGTHRYIFVLFKGNPKNVPTKRNSVVPDTIITNPVATKQFIVKAK